MTGEGRKLYMRYREIRARAGIPVAVMGIALLVCLGMMSRGLAQSTPDVLVVGNFSEATVGNQLPEGWKPLTFRNIDRYTLYRLVEDDGKVVVRAESDRSSSGLTREIRINPKEYPLVSWEWKVPKVLVKGDVSKKEGDDYPARVYITFEYDSSRVGLIDKAKYEAIRLFYGQYPPLGAINYIWESKAPVGTMVPNPFTDQVVMFVLRSGEGDLNSWVSESRNVYEDYKKAFGQEPPMITGVAIMSDTDNTQESAIAYFGDIVFRKP